MASDGPIVFSGKGIAVHQGVTVLLGLLLSVLAFVLLVLVFFPGPSLTVFERIISTGVVLLMATPLVIQIRSLRSRVREMQGNFLALYEDGVRVRLSGAFRAGKGLPEIPGTHLRWSEVTGVTSQRRKFVYRSLVPFVYPLDVYTLVTAGRPIAFTKECVPQANAAARAIARRIGQEVRRIG